MPSDTFRVLITGSRTWNQPQTITDALTKLHAEHGEALTVVHGACSHGADHIADTWCATNTVTVERHPADWDQHGKSAGHHRNAAMVATRPDLCLAFIRDHSPGATDCANLAERAGIPTTRHHHNSQKLTGPLTRTAPSSGLRPRETLLAAALDAAARGWPVFPLIPGRKEPAFPNHGPGTCTGRDPRCRATGAHVGWERRATTDPDRIRRAWSTRPYNVGIATGPAGLVVIDLDMPKPGEETPPPEWAIEGVHDGGDVFAVICQRAGQPWPGDTYTSRTCRDGTHLFYQHPPDGPRFRNTKGGQRGSLGWLIDTRAWGGYVVAAGSIVEGRRYWIACDAPAAPLPAFLAQPLTPQPAAPARPVTHTLPGGTVGAYLRAVLERETGHVTAAPDHHNDALYIAAVNLGRLIAGGALDPDQATQALEHAGEAVGLKPAAISRTIASGFRAGAARPRSVAA